MELQAQTITNAAYERIKSDILSGKYKPGQRLLEKELSELLQVSRTPIRDTLIRLEQEGLVVAQPHRGVFVRKLTQKNIQDYYQTRAVLDGLGAELATKNVTDDSIKHFERLLEQMRLSLKIQDASDDKEIISINDQFHDFIFKLAGNEVLDNMRKTLAHPIALVRVTSWIDSSRKEEVVNEHEEIIRAIIQGDSEIAKKVAEKHVYHAWKSAECNLHRLPGDKEG